MHHLGNPSVGARVQQDARAIDIHRTQEVFIFGERHLGDIVKHHVYAIDGRTHRRRVAYVTLHEIDVDHAGVGVIQVEDANRISVGAQLRGK